MARLVILYALAAVVTSFGVNVRSVSEPLPSTTASVGLINGGDIADGASSSKYSKGIGERVMHILTTTTSPNAPISFTTITSITAQTTPMSSEYNALGDTPNATTPSAPQAPPTISPEKIGTFAWQVTATATPSAPQSQSLPTYKITSTVFGVIAILGALGLGSFVLWKRYKARNHRAKSVSQELLPGPGAESAASEFHIYELDAPQRFEICAGDVDRPGCHQAKTYQIEMPTTPTRSITSSDSCPSPTSCTSTPPQFYRRPELSGGFWEECERLADFKEEEEE
jgi:hypothetical protein